MRLVCLQIRAGLARIGIFRLKQRYYGPKGIFWTIGVYSYFDLLSYCIISKYRGLQGRKIEMGDITITYWCQCNFKIKSPAYLLCYLLCRVRHRCSIIMMICVHMWSHTLNYVQFLVSDMFNEYGCLVT